MQEVTKTGVTGYVPVAPAFVLEDNRYLLYNGIYAEKVRFL